MTREEEIKFRDECAKLLLPILTEHDMADQLRTEHPSNVDIRLRGIVAGCFAIADAMLEEKKKRDQALTKTGN